MKDADGNFVWKTLEEIGAGDGNSVTEVVPADKSLNVEDKAIESFEGHQYEVKVNLSAEADNAIELKNDGLYVANQSEYAIVKDPKVEGSTTITYHLTKDGENIAEAIIVPDDVSSRVNDLEIKVDLPEGVENLTTYVA